MSALGNGDDPVQEDDKTKTFAFTQPQATSSYLVSLAVGDLHFRPCSSRTGVWAEESVVDKAKYEFGEVEEMVTAGEKICGPYRWGRYDVRIYREFEHSIYSTPFTHSIYLMISPLNMHSLTGTRHATFLPVWRYGESVSYLCDTHTACGRSKFS